MTLRRAVGRSVLAIGLLGAPGLAQASPADLFGFGPRSEAMGATGAALGRGFEATYENPALLSWARRRELTLGYQQAVFSLRADGAGAPGELSTEHVRGTFIGAVLPLPFGGVLKDRIGAGIGVFTPTNLIVRARLLFPETPQYPVLADRAQSLALSMGAGVDLGYGLRVGGGALALAELTGTAVVRTDASGRVGTVVDDQLVAAYAPVFGATFDAGDFTFGLAYRGELTANFDVLVQVHDLGQLVIPDLHISGVAQYDPRQLQLEVAWRQPTWRVVGGATYKDWSRFSGWAQATVRCPSTEPDCAAKQATPPPVDFHDTVVLRLGAEVDFALRGESVSHLRAGWFREPTPVPDQSGASNYLDADRNALTLGYGVSLGKPLPPFDVDFFYQYHLLSEREQRKDPSVACDPAADPECTQNAGYPSITAKGHVQVAGVTLGVKF